MPFKFLGQGLTSIALLLALMPLSCSKQVLTGQAKADPTLDSRDGEGLLMLSKTSFPTGAARLVLKISSIASEIDEQKNAFRCNDHVDQGVFGGLGLKQGMELAREIPPPDDCYKTPRFDDSDRGERLVEVQRGEDVKPIRLLVGPYLVRAEFFDESSNLIYKGSAEFDIADGQQTMVKILLKKVESGDVSIDFEVEKPSGPLLGVPVDIVAIYEGSSRHDITENVRVRVPDTAVILSLTSYESVNWQIIGGANLKRIILSGYEKQTASHSTKATVTSYCYENGCSERSYPSFDSRSSYGSRSECDGGWFYNMKCPQKKILLNWLKTTALGVQNISIRSEQGAYTAPNGGFNLP
jgi:hypothetical protein